MAGQKKTKADALSWLLEPDSPAVRYLAMRDLLDYPMDHKDLLLARKTAYEKGPIAEILDEMHPDGYWAKSGPGYHRKYRGTVWSIIALSQLGAQMDQDARIADACAYLLDHTYAEGGYFSMTGAPSGTIDCLQGNLCAALVDLGCKDPRLEKAFEWMARSVIGEGVAPATDEKAKVRYYSGKSGPKFVCGFNGNKPCAWGAVKVMTAFGKLPVHKRTAMVKSALRMGADLLLSVDPAVADYPTKKGDDKPSSNWFKFGFPVFYITDLLQNVEALVRLGYAHDRRLKNAMDKMVAKKDALSRWPLEYTYAGKSWGSFGAKGSPSKWVTLRVLRVLKQAKERA